MVPQTEQTISFEDLAARVAASGLIPSAQLTTAVQAAQGDPLQLEKELAATGLLLASQIEALREGRIQSLRIGNYEVLDRLGAGGMGTVFKARHRRMKRIVALKVLAANLSQNTAFVQRFQREVETIARLGHPNIVMAYDADEDEVGHFLVMEFINGRDLAGIVEGCGPMTVAEAVDCTLQSARGLAYAHSQDIIHRDIKPHNLLRDDHGIVKVTDLGLARLTQGAEGPGNLDVTMAGGIIGTASFMPPEQAVDSTAIDHRADIYSLAATLHFLLTGRPPYMGPTIMSILLKHRESPIPSLRADRSDVPAELDELFARMLAKRTEQRVQTMSEVVAALDVIARSLGSSSPVQPSPQLQTTIRSNAGIAPGGTSVALERFNDQTIAIPQPGSGGPKRVLMVEPSRAQAAIFKTFLQEPQATVVGTVATGAEAIAAIRQHSPSVVLSAMHLRDTTGIELAASIRAEMPQRAPGFILITSDGDEHDTAGLSQLHRVLTLRKPFTAEQLQEAIDVATGSSRLDAPTLELPPKTLRRQAKVLVVDDSGAARAHERITLQGMGFVHFQEASDGAQAIAAATRESFDLIVTDYNMPLMDGRALVSYLRQNPPTAHTPIVMVTTETDPRILDPVRALGVQAIFEKAFRAELVSAVLGQWFE